MAKPAHKQDDPAKFPGQIKWDCLDTTLDDSRSSEKTLNDYIKRKEKQYDVGTSKTPKLTFEEWWTELGLCDDGDSVLYTYTLMAWKAAQENK